ncbi:glutamate synthase central domain-containing protein, partial [Staphylococcus aureus]
AKQGAEILVLEVRGLVEGTCFAMLMLLAVSYVLHLLIKADIRISTSLSAKTGETQEVHHVALLLSYVAKAIVPLLSLRP